MKLFRKKYGRASPELVQASRTGEPELVLPPEPACFEKELYDRLRAAVPVIDAAIQKVIRLTGGFRLICEDERLQPELDRFCETVPVGLTGQSIGTFADCRRDRRRCKGPAHRRPLEWGRFRCDDKAGSGPLHKGIPYPQRR